MRLCFGLVCVPLLAACFDVGSDFGDNPDHRGDNGDRTGSSALGARAPGLRQAATATDSSVSVDEDGSVTFDLQGDGLATTFAIKTLPLRGTLTQTSTGSAQVTYVPEPDVTGGDSFTFTATDIAGESSPATVTLTIQPVNDPPVANAQDVAVVEDTAKTFTLTASDVDVDDSATFVVVTDPTLGTITASGATVTYTPGANVNGNDALTFRVTDSGGATSTATVNLLIAAVDDVPTALPQSVATDEDANVGVRLTGVDVDLDGLVFAIEQAPQKGTFAGTPPDFVYVPNANNNGSDSFTFTVFDGTTTSAAATVSIAIASINDAPLSASASLTTPEDTTLGITLVATDVDGDALTIAITQGPTAGVLTGTSAARSYAPNANENGVDSFVYVVTDPSGATSDPGTIDILVDPRNDAPVAAAQTITTDEDVGVDIVLAASDADGDPLGFAVAEQPTRGTLSGSAPNLRYTPARDQSGSDSFTFVANDGSASSTATVSITMRPQNDAPVADNASVTTDEDVGRDVTLTASDVDGDALVFAIAEAPQRGTLSGTPPALRYTPQANESGDDRFTFTARDGRGAVATGTITVSIRAVDDAPVVIATPVVTDEDTAVSFSLQANDVDSTGLVFALAQLPSRGTLTGTAPDLTYRPAPDQNGADSFTFTVRDATTTVTATTAVTIRAVNDAARATGAGLTTNEDTAVTVLLAATDVDGSVDSVDGDTLVFAIARGPTRGRLTGTAPNLSYLPNPDDNGSDSFSFTARDASTAAGAASTATVSITIRPVNDAPVADALQLTLAEDETVDGAATARDVDGDVLRFRLETAPSRGAAVVDAGGAFSFAGFDDENGVDAFVVVVSDGAASASLRIGVAITPVNDAPVLAAPATAVFLAGVNGTVLVAGDDVDGDVVTLTLTAAPTAVALQASGADGTLRWTPSFDDAGFHNLVVTASDGRASASATIVARVDVDDSDGDGVPDFLEQALGLDDGEPDSDRDGINDGDEVGSLDDPRDQDNDGDIDALDDDSDGDGIADLIEAGDDDLDTAPVDSDDDGAADVIDRDSDNDDVRDDRDNCRVVANVDQANVDRDARGDACDDDSPAAEGEGEGEGEGEPADAGEGEGEIAGEGEGEIAAEGEGEIAGEGEGEIAAEGEGEIAAGEGEGEGRGDVDDDPAVGCTCAGGPSSVGTLGALLLLARFRLCPGRLRRRGKRIFL